MMSYILSSYNVMDDQSEYAVSCLDQSWEGIELMLFFGVWMDHVS